MYTIHNGQSDEVVPPNVKDISISKRPGVETSVSIINGKRSGFIKYTYQIVISKEGKFILPPAKARIDGKWIQSNSLTIEVGKPVIQKLRRKRRRRIF
jgi:hypothetical protein